MKTDCHQTQLQFQELDGREVRVNFDAGQVTSDAGGLLLREVALSTGLLARFSSCFGDERDRRYVEHPLQQLVAQRVFAIAQGYEDVNDHDSLGRDPMMALLCEKSDVDGRERKRRRDLGRALAGKSTINRLEQGGSTSRYHKIHWNEQQIDQMLVDYFLGSFRQIPGCLILDLDATDVVLHGNQEGRFFHGYYDAYCYLPLFITCGHHILCARLRPSDRDASAGCVEELQRIVQAIRKRFPKIQIIVRADSGFAREELMAWCEANDVRFVLGLARNDRLARQIEDAMTSARAEHETSGEPARRFCEFKWRTRTSWSTSRRVVGKAEYLPKGPNPRFVVTSLDADSWPADVLYERLYCARGDMENRIKEHQLDMFGDRLSSHSMRSNQLRLYFACVAYMLITTLRRVALVETELEKAQAGTIRLKLLKIGAVITTSCRRIWISMASGYPYQHLFWCALEKLKRLRYAFS